MAAKTATRPKADFSGYATKAGLKCSDGRIIMPNSFKHMDGQQVPLVWQHGHKEPANILGHALLEARDGHVYAHCHFNDTPSGKIAKALVMHKDINRLSIYANQLKERIVRDAKQVLHGMIREVSLVISGANPGAVIDNIRLQHSDDPFDFTELEDEAIISTGDLLHIWHADEDADADEDEDDEGEEGEEDDEEDEDGDKAEHADGMTIKDVYDSFSPEQKKVVHFMIGAALEADSSAAQSGIDNEGDLAHQKGTETTMNVFEKAAGGATTTDDRQRIYIDRDGVRGIIKHMMDRKTTLKSALEEYAFAHGIEDLDLLFPDAKSVTATPDLDKRRTEWVKGVLDGTKHNPFSRIKSFSADITQDEARAKGYIKGEFKKEEWFRLTKRTTGPTTVYKKQKLDRDDIIDITELDIVAFMKAEMRLMLEEEVAGAILISDGRAVDDEDKIKDPIGAQDGTGIRSILHDNELYVATVNVNIDDANSNYQEAVDQIILNSHLLKGSGTPTFYTTRYHLSRMLLTKDALGRKLWANKAELAAELMVDTIVEVEVMQRETDLLGIIVNLQDYSVGTDRGGETTFFDDFDIDYNQLKYLYETRLSGALTKIRSAMVVKMVASTDVLVVPNVPTFVSSTGVVTIVATTGVVYKNDETDATLSTGAQAAIAAGASITVRAEPASGYYLANNVEEEWTFTRDAA